MLQRCGDRLSGRGIFGNEYGGWVPARRWLLTKLDLLLMQAVGYPLRETSCLVPLTVVNDSLSNGQVSLPYADNLANLKVFLSRLFRP